MKMKRYAINVRETALQPREKHGDLQIQRSQHSLQQGWNTTPREKL